jgi:ABC-type Na+ efflux pump permease subunit
MGTGGVVLTWAIGALAVAIWVAVAMFIVKTARDRRERRLLIGLLILFVVIGPLVIAAYYGGLFGSDAGLGKLALVMLIPPAIAAVVAQASGAGHGLRSFLVSAWGSIFLIGAAAVLLIAAFTVGGACLELE